MPARIRRFRLLALAGPLLALVPLLSGVPAVAADPVSGTASLAVSKAQVTYGGASYRCLQQHTSIVSWEPPATPALWQRL